MRNVPGKGETTALVMDFCFDRASDEACWECVTGSCCLTQTRIIEYPRDTRTVQ